MSDELPNNTEMTDEQITELYNNIQTPEGNKTIPETSEAPSAGEQKAWELAEGVVVNDETQLLDYAKKGHELSQQQQDWLKEKEEYTPIVDRYKEIDEFATQNPEWWDHVQNSYGNREQNDATIPQEQNLSPELQSIQNQITEISQFMNAQKHEQDQRARVEEDSLLDAEINSVREKHSNMDFTTPDDKGFTLEQKVLKHAQEIGTSSFRAAFRDYAYDKLMAKATEHGKESLGKDIERKTKLGILGTSKKATEAAPSAKYDKSKSYDTLLQEAMTELGI